MTNHRGFVGHRIYIEVVYSRFFAFLGLGWAVRVDGRTHGRFRLKTEAVGAGRVHGRAIEAGGGKAELYIKLRNGTIADKETYGDDPEHIRGEPPVS